MRSVAECTRATLGMHLYDDGSLSSQQLKDQLALAYEYGQKTNLTPDVILEHGKPLMKQAALELVRTYFD